MLKRKANQIRQWSFIANHLRNLEQRRLQSSRTTRYQSRRTVTQKRIGLIAHHLDRRTLQELLIIRILDGRSSCKHHLVILKPLCHLNHGRQIILNLLQTASGKQSNNRAMPVQIILFTKLHEILMIFRPKLIHLFCRRITYIMDRITVLFLEERHLERQDGEKFGDITLDTADSPFLPRPDFRRNIIVCRNISLLFQELSDIQIKSRIIYKDYHIRFPFHNIFLASFHIRKDGTQMHQHRNKAHIGKLLIMLDTSATFGSHQVATEEPKFSKLVNIF